MPSRFSIQLAFDGRCFSLLFDVFPIEVLCHPGLGSKFLLKAFVSILYILRTMQSVSYYLFLPSLAEHMMNENLNVSFFYYTIFFMQYCGLLNLSTFECLPMVNCILFCAWVLKDY